MGWCPEEKHCKPLPSRADAADTDEAHEAAGPAGAVPAGAAPAGTAPAGESGCARLAAAAACCAAAESKCAAAVSEASSAAHSASLSRPPRMGGVVCTGWGRTG
jgi:hypothetical protein